MNKIPMLNQEQIHRYFNHLSGAKRIEFLYGLLHLCQPLELRYLGTCLEEIARKDYEYLYHAEQKTNHSIVSVNSSSTNATDSGNSSSSQVDLSSDEKLDLTDQFTRAHAIVDIALLWAKNRQCAVRIFRRLKASESVKLVDMLLERDDLDERVMDEILIIFCLAANHPAFSFDMRTQMSQTLKELEKRERKLKLLKANHPTHNSNANDDETVEILDDSNCSRYHSLSTSVLNSSTLSVHASPLLTRLAVVSFDTESTPMRILIKADWSDNNSTLNWKTPNDIRSFHLQLSNIVYHDDLRLERLMNISGYLRDTGSTTETDIEAMKKNIGIYIAHLVYFSSYISTISTLAKFFNSSLKLIDSKQRLYNSSNGFDESMSSSTPYSNGLTPLQCDLPVQPSADSENKSVCSPKLSSAPTNNNNNNTNNKSKIQTDVAKQARSTIPTSNGTQTGLEVRSEETQTDRLPGPGYILAEHQDYLRRYSMEELAKLTPTDLITDGLDPTTAQLLCGALDDLKPMSVHLSSNSKTSRSPCSFVHMPSTSSAMSPTPVVPQTSSTSTSLPPLLDAALMAVVQQQQQPQPSPGAHPSLSSSPSPKLPKTGSINGIPQLPPAIPLPPSLTTGANGPNQGQHHVPLLTAHSFLYNPAEPYIFPITIPPGFSSATPDFMRLFTPNMAALPPNGTNPNSNTFMNPSSISQGSVSNSRSSNQTNGTNTPPEPNGGAHHPSPPLTNSNSSVRHPSQSQQQQQQQQQTQSSSSSSTSQQNQQQQQQQQQTSSSSSQSGSSQSHSHPPPHQHHHHHHHHHSQNQSHPMTSRFRQRAHYPSDSVQYQQNGLHPQQQNQQQRQSQSSYSQQSHSRTRACYTCGDIGHLAFACPEQYSNDSSYSHPNPNPNNNREGYKLDYRPQQSTPTNLQQQQQQQQQQQNRQMRSNSNSKTKLRDNS